MSFERTITIKDLNKTFRYGLWITSVFSAAVLWASYWPNKDVSVFLAKVTNTVCSSGEQQHLVVNLIGHFPLNLLLCFYSLLQGPASMYMTRRREVEFHESVHFILIPLLGEFYIWQICILTCTRTSIRVSGAWEYYPNPCCLSTWLWI